MIKCKLLMLNFDADLSFINKIEAIQKSKELKNDCEKTLNEQLFLDLRSEGITCYDKNDLTVFRLVYCE